MVKWEGVEEASWHTKDELYDYETPENIEEALATWKEKEKKKATEKKKQNAATPKKETQPKPLTVSLYLFFFPFFSLFI